MQMWAELKDFPLLDPTLIVGLGWVCSMAYLFIVANS